MPESPSPSPDKDRQPQRVALPGDIGWAIDKPGPKAGMNPIDFICSDYPKDRLHVKDIDDYRANFFPRAPGSTAASIDKKYGVAIDIFKAMNVPSQRHATKMVGQMIKAGVVSRTNSTAKKIDFSKSSNIDSPIRFESTQETLLNRSHQKRAS